MGEPRLCIEPGCEEPAGTPWTPLWCLKHDEERRARISRHLDEIIARLEAREATDADR